LEQDFQHLGLSDIDQGNFESVALTVFRYQASHCAVYRDFINHLKVDTQQVKTLDDIPFLPISFFKSHQVISEREIAQVEFKSSGTTGDTTSSHFVADLSLYELSFNNAFNIFYGHPKNYCILGLLPSYLERNDSSLVYMVNQLIKKSDHEKSGFYLNNYQELFKTLMSLKKEGVPTILFGVTFALLELAEQFPGDFEDLIIIETGGMKGKREEIIRKELHEKLNNAFGTSNIHSEYGMTELLSQAYSFENELFHCPPWMKVNIKDLNDPLADVQNGKTGRIQVIDLANINSCSFISTNDLGQLNDNGTFKVLGRVDHSDVRGCSLMYID